MNMAKVELRGCGIQVMYEEISEAKLTKAITELLSNPKYHRNAKNTAKRFRDRPLTPQQEVVFWTEFVARNEGALFMRAAGNDLNFFQFYLLDVYFAFIIAVGMIFVGIKFTVKFTRTKILIKLNDKESKKKL